MNNLANFASGRALNDFVHDLLQNPVTNDRFTATFTLTDTRSGSVAFQHRHSSRTAVLQWEARAENDQLQALLIYNQRFVLLQCAAADFRRKVSDTYQIF